MQDHILNKKANETMALWGLFGDLKDLFKLKSQVNEDNTAFKFVSKLSVALCIVATLLLALDSYVGTSIECVGSDSDGLEAAETAVNQFCWIHGSRYIPESTMKKMMENMYSDVEGRKELPPHNP